MTRTFGICLDKEDFEILDKYGFDYEKNFSQMASDIANELRQEEEKGERS